MIYFKKNQKAEQNFLVSKPTCFLITGKPGAGTTTIAKKLALAWKAEFINRKKKKIIVLTVLNQNL